jgi:hypothetical protein
VVLQVAQIVQARVPLVVEMEGERVAQRVKKEGEKRVAQRVKKQEERVAQALPVQREVHLRMRLAWDHWNSLLPVIQG